MKNKDFSKLIKEFRERKGLSKSEFARKIGVSAPLISNVESGMIILSDNRIDLATKILNLNEEENLELKDVAAAFSNKLPRYIIKKIMEDDELFEYVKKYGGLKQ